MTGATATARKKGGARSKRTRHIPYKSDKGIHTEGPQSDINVTPLVDVCLVLLIIFMVVTPMLGRGKDVALPILTAADQHKEGDQVFVSVNDDGAWIETDLYLSKGDFLGALDESLKVAAGKAAANGYKGPLLFLKGDKDTDYANIRIVMEWITSSDTQIQDIALVVDLKQ